MCVWYGNTVLHQSEICIELQLSCSWLPVHMMGSCSMQATCGGHHEIFSYSSTAGTLQEGSHVGTGWICEHLCTRMVSLRYQYGYRFGTGETLEKREQSTQTYKWTNCILSLLVFHHIAFLSLEPLSRQKSTSHKDSFINTLPVSHTFSTIRYPASRPHCESQ